MRREFTWKIARGRLPLGRRTLTMGVINVTPDSFFDGGRLLDPRAAVDQALALVDQGADILDIGGESTRPFSDGIGAEEEKARVLPVVEALAGAIATPISIDTKKSAVAEAAVAAGARIINDVSGGRADPGLLKLAARTGCGLVLMHMRGTPRDMQLKTEYGNLIEEIKTELAGCVESALAAGVPPEAIVVDPGIGFAKKPEQNLELIRRLGELNTLGFPILLGPSRKSFIGRALESRGMTSQPEDRLAGSLAAAGIGAFLGAHILRVHDVGLARQALAVADSIRNGSFYYETGDSAHA